MKLVNFSKKKKSEAYELILHEICSCSPKNILLSGGSTPMHFYSKALDKINSKFLVVDERITSDVLRLNQQNIKKQYSDFREINFPTDEESINDFSEELTDIYDKFLPADLCILGMGEDGHYASIFPKYKKLFQSQKNLFFFCKLDHNNEIRFSLTEESIKRSKKIILLISHENKKKLKIINSIVSNSIPKLPINNLFQKCKEKMTIIIF